MSKTENTESATDLLRKAGVEEHDIPSALIAVEKLAEAADLSVECSTLITARALTNFTLASI